MTIWETIVYILSMISFVITMVGISRENKVLQITGTIAMATIIGAALCYW